MVEPRHGKLSDPSRMPPRLRERSANRRARRNRGRLHPGSRERNVIANGPGPTGRDSALERLLDPKAHREIGSRSDVESDDASIGEEPTAPHGPNDREEPACLRLNEGAVHPHAHAQERDHQPCADASLPLSGASAREGLELHRPEADQRIANWAAHRATEFPQRTGFARESLSGDRHSRRPAPRIGLPDRWGTRPIRRRTRLPNRFNRGQDQQERKRKSDAQSSSGLERSRGEAGPTLRIPRLATTSSRFGGCVTRPMGISAPEAHRTPVNRDRLPRFWSRR